MSSNNLTFKTLLDRFCELSAEKAALEHRINQIQRELSPPKSIVELKEKTLYLN